VWERVGERERNNACVKESVWMCGCVGERKKENNVCVLEKERKKEKER
jgi:hypothetical protein